jgi:hypothetical protein
MPKSIIWMASRALETDLQLAKLIHWVEEPSEPVPQLVLILILDLIQMKLIAILHC